MASIETNAPARGQKLYFAAWRWHFYAGFYVVPFLLMLAVTGLIMLWISVLAGLGDEKMTVPPQGSPLPVSALQAAAEQAVPGGWATQYVAPLGPDHVAVFAITTDAGKAGVTLNPYTGEVLHSFPWRDGWYDFANTIHGTLMLGDTGDRLIEIAASLALLLVVTGVYLHWPRSGGTLKSTLVPDLAKRGRALWKSLHGVLGFWMSLVMVAFLVSGLSWTGIWGDKMIQGWNSFPAEKWNNVPLSDKTHASMNHNGSKEVPWNLEKVPMPESGSLAGATAIQGPVTIDSVAAFADGLGFDRRYQVNLPDGAEGVWTISHDSMSNDGPNPAADRTLHIDQYTGNVLADVQYSDYSPYAKFMAWGIAFHEGDMGLWNIALNTLFCLSMIFLPVSGVVLWWKRRPAGAPRLAAPPAPADLPQLKGVVLIAGLMSLAFPVLGLTILAVLALDVLILSNIPPLKRLVS
ncbi:PepSY-associated TM helix domain-containing protein [Tabrizicola fusiformis]|uniref:PepSY-associated TM helix domain-containing protein n=1 Tax=Tabrizicola sp. SY72 TaxID=2741673 RepID=UPI001573C4AB|nr:PepSY domain-containing protein [Tabrizicola sp. SY72]NTT86125.1 PepSY domain-containing protein [Tabrizicola sp. SY72]